MTIQEAQLAVDKWIKTIGVRYYSELTNTALLSEECGEVARIMARLYGDQSFKSKEEEASAHEDLQAELADTLFVLICLANQCGIDLDQALVKNMEFKMKRDQERHHSNEKLKSPFTK